MGTIISAEDVEEEGPCSDGNAAISGESGIGGFGSREPGRVQAGRGHGEAMLEVCQTLNTVHCGQWDGLVRKLLSKTLQVFAHATQGVRWGQRWSVGIAEGKGSKGEPDEVAG